MGRQLEEAIVSSTTCPAGNSMIDLYDTTTNTLVGSITEAELKFLEDALEEESLKDHDYYFDSGTIDFLADDGNATDHLLSLLRKAIGTSEGIELRWQAR
jgi:hypothetical protein